MASTGTVMVVSGRYAFRPVFQYAPGLNVHDPNPPLPIGEPGYPADRAHIESAYAAPTTDKTLNLPAYSVGALLLVVLRSTGPDMHTTPSGWTALVLNDGSDASDDVTSIWYKYADGTEGALVTVTTSTATTFAGLAYAITGAAPAASGTPPEVSNVAVGTTPTLDPPSLAPTGGSKEYLFLYVGASDGAVGVPPVVPPPGYGGLVVGDVGDVGAPNGYVFGYSRQAWVSTEDPPALTLTSTPATGTSAWTIAIHPNYPATLLAGALSGTGQTTGTLTTTLTLAAGVTGTAAASGALSAEVTLGGALAGAGGVAGGLTPSVILAGAPTGAGAVAGALATGVWLAAGVPGTGLVVGALTTDVTAASSITGAALLTGACTTTITLVSAITGTAAGAGDLSAASAGAMLEGAMAGLALVTGTLQTATWLQGTVSGTALVVGSLATDIDLALYPPTWPVVFVQDTNDPVDRTAHVIPFDQPPQAGDLLVVCLGSDGTPTFTWPGGWPTLNNRNGEGGHQTKYRVATGTEGASLTVTTSTAEKTIAVAYRIPKGTWSGFPLGGGSQGSGTAPNPSSLAPWTPLATKFTTLTLITTDALANLTAYPTPPPYPLYQGTINQGLIDGINLQRAGREVETVSENPPPATCDAGTWWTSTVAVVGPQIVLGTAQLAGGLTTGVTCAASVAGAATGAAALTTDVRCAAGVTGTASVFGALSGTGTFLQGAGAGVATVQAGLQTGAWLAGACAGLGATTGALQTDSWLGGALTGAAAVAGDLTTVAGIALAGDVDGTATLQGALRTGPPLAPSRTPIPGRGLPGIPGRGVPVVGGLGRATSIAGRQPAVVRGRAVADVVGVH
jgi:hypothetical protein